MSSERKSYRFVPSTENIQDLEQLIIVNGCLLQSCKRGTSHSKQYNTFQFLELCLKTCLFWMFTMQPAGALSEPSRSFHAILKADGVLVGQYCWYLSEI